VCLSQRRAGAPAHDDQPAGGPTDAAQLEEVSPVRTQAGRLIFLRLRPNRSAHHRLAVATGGRPFTAYVSAESMANRYLMTGEKLRRRHLSTAFGLKFQNLQAVFPAADNNSGFFHA